MKITYQTHLLILKRELTPNPDKFNSNPELSNDFSVASQPERYLVRGHGMPGRAYYFGDGLKVLYTNTTDFYFDSLNNMNKGTNNFTRKIQTEEPLGNMGN